MEYIFGKNIDIEGQINKHYSGVKKLLLCDRNLYSLYSQKIDSIASDILVLEPGERAKSKDSLFAVLELLMKKSYTRSDCIVSFGGGVIGDLGGLASSLYMRGMEHVIIATSIIAMADSSIGGKTAINYNCLKNIFGTFYEPSIVIADTSFLKTLPDKEKKSGMGEILKVCLLSGHTELLHGDIDCAIEHAAQYKMKLVERDLLDKGQRHLLNFGHTMGHAVELEYGITHGEAVAMGIDFICKLSDQIGISNNLTTRVREIMQKFDFSLIDSVKINENVLDRLYNDKKRESKSINLVMLEDIGKPIIKAMAIDDIRKFALENC